MSRTSLEANPKPTRVLAILATIWAVVYPVCLALAYRHGAPRPFIANIAFVPMNVLFATVCGLVAFAPPERRLRRGFALLAATWTAVIVGNICKFVFVVRFPHVDWSDSWWVNMPFLVTYPIGVAALLSFPLARRAHLERRKFFFDALTVLLGGGLAIWRLVLIPTAGSPTTMAGFFDLAYPLGDILFLTGLTTLLLRRRRDGRRAAPALLFGGLLLFTLSDLANDLVLKEIGFGGVAWTDIVFMVAYTIMTWGAYFYGRPLAEPSREPKSADQTSAVQPFSPLPYAALALCAVLLLIDAAHARSQPWSILAVGEIVLTLLVVGRQIHAVRENARLVTQQAARDNEARFRSLVQHSSDVIAVVDPADGGMIRYVSPSVTRVLGYTNGSLDGRPLVSLLHPEDAPRAERMLAEAVTRSGVTSPTEWRIRHQDGRWMFVEAVGTNLVHEPTVRGVVVNTRDITERKSLEAQLVHQAFHDPLTGLANRALFLDRVTHALEVTARYGRQPVAVLFLDLDNFKTINDSFGHIPADQLLAVVARRLVDAVRTSDTVARLGGDEFAILLEDPGATMPPTLAAERITHSLSAPFLVEGKEVFVSASIGIAIANQDFSPADLLRNADTAMYQAKALGKARYEVFEARMHAETLARLELENELRRALERKELSLRYQPIVSLRDGSITGMEALVRWEHPRRGTLLPAEFIALAEDTGLIVPIGEWVLSEACHQAKEWQDRYGPAVPFTMTVNVSGHQLQNAGMAAAVQSAIADSGLDPATLVLEITESVLMQQTDTLLTHLRALKALRVRLAIDDFGTGYSSLSYLKRFPIDILKIAKPFVDDVGSGLTDSALARAIIGLGDTLKLQTIAEGIELPAQLAELRALGCELGQGYYFARPLAADAIEALLDAPTALPGPAQVNVTVIGV
jgi:diguanylate cyclase (GGDEF)-like protein/PAS domain S-box-containing protein